MSFAFVGASLPQLIAEFGISIGRASLAPATVQISYAILCFAGGIVADFVAKRRILVVGLLVVAIGAGIVGLSETFWINLFAFGLVGIGGGIVFISSNLLVIELFPENPGSFLNIHHLVFAICSFIAPVVMSYSITSGAGWQMAFRGLSGLAILLIVMLVGNRHPLVHPTPPPPGNRWKSRVDALRSRNSRFVVLLTFFAIGSQFTIMFLAVTFLADAKSFPVPLASTVLSGFYVLLAVGRLTCSVLVRRYSNRLILSVLLSLLSLSIMVAILGNPQVAGWAIVVTGLASSGLYPSILAMASDLTHTTSRGTVIGSLSMAGGVGGMLITQLTAGVSEAVGIAGGFWIIFATATGTLLFLSIRGRRLVPIEH